MKSKTNSVCLDYDRRQRCGFPETIFCEGKRSSDLIEIATGLKKNKQNFLGTRATRKQYTSLRRKFTKAKWHEEAACITIQNSSVKKRGKITIVCAGTCDVPVAEEAAVTAEFCGANIERVYDVGVAGIHRLMGHVEKLNEANAVIVVAGMEGALPSVVGGLISAPLIAVPTSVGYGAAFGGLSALMGMLNSCAPGISTVNIDNGFGAAMMALAINNKVEEK